MFLVIKEQREEEEEDHEVSHHLHLVKFYILLNLFIPVKERAKPQKKIFIPFSFL